MVNLKGQSAIEYLMTYGWMLLVVAIVGGAIFSIAQQQNVESVSGFVGGDVVVDEFGITSDDEFQLNIRNTGAQSTTINSINVSEGGRYSAWEGESSLSVGDTETITLANISEGDSAESLDVGINYGSGGLDNLVADGSISGSLEITEESSNIDETPEQTQFYTDFSEYSEGNSLFDADWSGKLEAEGDLSFTASEISGEDVALFSRPENSGREVASYDKVTDTSGEIEVYATWQYSNSESGEMRPSILVHGSGDTHDDISGVRFENDPDNDGDIEISEYDAENEGYGSNQWSGDLAEKNLGDDYFDDDEYYKFRGWTNGSSAEMTVWKRGEDEDTDGETIYTDDIAVDSGEFNGFFEYYDDATDYPFVDIGFGIEGEEAPTSPVE